MLSARILRSLVLLLVLLQIAIPFLHAHLGKMIAHEGFHVPGLEFLNDINQKPELQSSIVGSFLQEQIVGIGSALQSDYQADYSEDVQVFFFLKIFLDLAILSVVLHFFCYPSFLVKQLFAYFSAPPRAPPTLLHS